MGRATAHFFGPAPRGPGEEPKGQISLNIIKFQLQSQFQRFLNHTLCVFSHISDEILFGRLGHAPGVGLRGTIGGWKFSQIWCVSYKHELHMQRHHFWGPRPLGPWGGAKRSNIIQSELQSQFQRFLIETLCIFSQMKDI